MPVTVSDVETTLGRALSDMEQRQVGMWLSDAMLPIRLRFGDRVGDLDPDVVDFVVREAVALKVKQPDPVTRRSVAVDDARVEREFARASGQVTILDEWWRMLEDSLPDGGTRDAFTIRLVGGMRG